VLGGRASSIAGKGKVVTENSNGNKGCLLLSVFGFDSSNSSMQKFLSRGCVCSFIASEGSLSDASR